MKVQVERTKGNVEIVALAEGKHKQPSAVRTR